MKLEVTNKDCPGTFWVASVVLTCGPILQLRFEGYEDDGSQDFWVELNVTEIHPIGWCSANNKVLQPPDGEWGAVDMLAKIVILFALFTV